MFTFHDSTIDLYGSMVGLTLQPQENVTNDLTIDLHSAITQEHARKQHKHDVGLTRALCDKTNKLPCASACDVKWWWRLKSKPANDRAYSPAAKGGNPKISDIVFLSLLIIHPWGVYNEIWGGVDVSLLSNFKYSRWRPRWLPRRKFLFRCFYATDQPCCKGFENNCEYRCYGN